MKQPGMKLPRSARPSGPDPGPNLSLPNLTAGTLRRLLLHRIELKAVCRRCRHQGLLFTADLAARLGADFPVDDLPELLKCVACGEKGTVVLAEVTR
jgi:hypothetical protein